MLMVLLYAVIMIVTIPAGKITASFNVSISNVIFTIDVHSLPTDIFVVHPYMATVNRTGKFL